MANRTLGTRQKLVFRGPDKGGPAGRPLKAPRNSLVVPALQRKAGAHLQRPGGKRQDEKPDPVPQAQKPADETGGRSG